LAVPPCGILARVGFDGGDTGDVGGDRCLPQMRHSACLCYAPAKMECCSAARRLPRAAGRGGVCLKKNRRSSTPSAGQVDRRYSKMDEKNKLYFGDNLKILRDYVEDASVDLIYLDPPFNSSAGELRYLCSVAL